MYSKRILMIVLCCLLLIKVQAQTTASVEEIDFHSLNLYNNAQWRSLILYGRENKLAGKELPLLRMRVGYAALMLGNYSQSLRWYHQVLQQEPDNNLALYYVYLNNIYLNNSSGARYYASRLSTETKSSEKISKIKCYSVETEYSYKMTTDTFRKNAQYARIGLSLQLGYKLEFQQSIAWYKQRISEPSMTSVTNNTNIDLNLKEYYGKLIFTASGKTSILGGFHYLNSPFNNYTFNNTIIFGGVNYASPFVHIKAIANLANLSDSTYHQYDVTISYFPLGNTKYYGISRATYSKSLIFSQIAGIGVTKNIWLEGNITFGSYHTSLENDALFVFNDIDTKEFKMGGSMYASLYKKLTLTVNYTFEQKLKYQTTNNYFYQHSITTGLSWKF